MENNQDLQAMEKINNIISKTNHEIIRLKTKTECYEKETEKMETAIKEHQKSIKEMEKEIAQTEQEIEDLQKSTTIQLRTLKINENSLTNQLSEKNRLEQLRKSKQETYKEILRGYKEEMEEYRLMHERTNLPYKKFKEINLEVQKAEIQLLMLEREQKNREEAKRRFDGIQKQIFQKTVVHFAKFCLEQSKSRGLDAQIKGEEKRSESLMLEYRQLQEAVKQKELKQRFEKKRSTDDFQKIQFPLTFSESVPMDQTTNQTEMKSKEKSPKTSLKPTNDFKKIEDLMNESFPKVSHEKPENLLLQKKFNEDNSKVRILKVDVVNPKTAPPKKSLEENTKPTDLEGGNPEKTENFTFPEPKLFPSQKSDNATDEKKIEENEQRKNLENNAQEKSNAEVKKTVRFAAPSASLPKLSLQLPFGLFDTETDLPRLSPNPEPDAMFPFMSPPHSQFNASDESHSNTKQDEETPQANAFSFGQSFKFFNMF